MKAVILAAGKSTRTYPLTVTKPKPLLKVANKAILEYNLEALEGIATEVVIVVGYRKEMVLGFVDRIKERFSFKIGFFEQKEQLGTGHATLILEDTIKGKFLMLMGDNIYSKEDISECIKHNYSILVKEVTDPENFGVVVENNNVLMNLVEKPQLFVSNLINCALYCFDEKIFKMLKKVKVSKRGEYEITDAIMCLKMEEDVICVRSKKWFPIGYPWDLFLADRFFRKGENNIDKNTELNGEAVNSSIGEECIIDGSVKNSIIFDDVTIEKNSVIEDSIIGNSVYFGGKIFSEENVISIVKKKPVNAGRLGGVIGDNVIAKDVIIKPGCKVWPNKEIAGKINEDVI